MVRISSEDGEDAVRMISVTESGGGTDLAESVREVFSATGPLSGSKDFEYRREQEEMAVAVAESFLKGHPLVAEAGTGVGKSLAYLVPAAKFALETGRKAVISTHTINLIKQGLTGLDVGDDGGAWRRLEDVSRPENH